MTLAARRKTIFALEMGFSLSYLMLCFAILHLLLRSLECSISHGPLYRPTLPKITHWLQWVLPESAVAGILGPIAIAVGFASVASVSQEALSSRLFRWFSIPVGMAVMAAILPLVESHMCLCSSNYEDGWPDEFVFLAVCLTLGYLGLRHAQRIPLQIDLSGVR